MFKLWCERGISQPISWSMAAILDKHGVNCRKSSGADTGGIFSKQGKRKKTIFLFFFFWKKKDNFKSQNWNWVVWVMSESKLLHHKKAGCRKLIDQIKHITMVMMLLSYFSWYWHTEGRTAYVREGVRTVTWHSIFFRSMGYQFSLRYWAPPLRANRVG